MLFWAPSLLPSNVLTWYTCYSFIQHCFPYWTQHDTDCVISNLAGTIFKKKYQPTNLLTSTRLLSWFIFWSNWIILKMAPVSLNLLHTGHVFGPTCLKCHTVRFVGQCTPKRVFLRQKNPNSCSPSSPPTYWCNILKCISDISDPEAPKGLHSCPGQTSTLMFPFLRAANFQKNTGTA